VCGHKLFGAKDIAVYNAGKVSGGGEKNKGQTTQRKHRALRAAVGEGTVSIGERAKLGIRRTTELVRGLPKKKHCVEGFWCVVRQGWAVREEGGKC